MTLTRELCSRVAGIGYRALGAECVTRAKQLIKDGVAVAAAGSGEAPVRLLVAHLRRLGGAPRATLWGHALRSSPMHAAYANGMATHVLDFEPMSQPPTHVVSTTVPVAFALAEAQGASGRDVVTAVAKGIEMQGRIQFAADEFEPERLRFHPPGVAGVMGATVTAAHLLGLDADQLAHALGIAASRAGALLANVGSMTKSTHCGHAGACGLEAAMLAGQGFTANAGIFDAPRGFVATYFPETFHRARLLAFGKPFRLVDPGLAIKLFPSQFATHWAITAALDLRARVRDPRAVSRLVLRAPRMAYIDRPQPATGLDGKFSLQYTAAAALLDGRVTIDSFTDARRFREDMRNLLPRIKLVQDAAIPGDWAGMRVEVHAELTDGKRIDVICRGPRGAWGRAPLTAHEHAAKLNDCLSRLLDARRSARLLERLDRLEKLDARGVRQIPASLAGRRLPDARFPRRTPRARNA